MRRPRKCLNCRVLFRPDPRNLRHRRYRSISPCRKANKAVSPTRLLPKTQNRNHLQGPKKGYNFKPVDLMQFHAVDSTAGSVRSPPPRQGCAPRREPGALPALDPASADLTLSGDVVGPGGHQLAA